MLMKDDSDQQISELFLAAICRSKNKAPLYVSFGDTISGPNAVRQLFANVLRVAENPDELNATTDQNKVQQFLNSKEATALQRLLTNGADESVICYLAAVAEDPNYKLGWYRVAMKLNGKPQLHAISNLIAQDSQNALPYYIRGMIEVKQGNLPAALRSIQLGNIHTVCNIERPPRPKGFQLKFPDDELGRHFKIVGQPVTDQGLDFILTRFEEKLAWYDSPSSRLREVCRAFTDEGARLRKLGRFADAEEYLETAHEFGLRMVTIQPRDNLILVTGIGSALFPKDEITAIYQSLGKTEQLQRFESDRLNLLSVNKELLQTFTTSKLTDNAVRDALLGKIDPFAESRRSIEKAMIESRLFMPP
jgi:tetratricopeptide (TPR) repeat protein